VVLRKHVAACPGTAHERAPSPAHALACPPPRAVTRPRHSQCQVWLRYRAVPAEAGACRTRSARAADRTCPRPNPPSRILQGAGDRRVQPRLSLWWHASSRSLGVADSPRQLRKRRRRPKARIAPLAGRPRTLRSARRRTAPARSRSRRSESLHGRRSRRRCTSNRS
jgi:hypothetical protein